MVFGRAWLEQQAAAVHAGAARTCGGLALLLCTAGCTARAPSAVESHEPPAARSSEAAPQLRALREREQVVRSAWSPRSQPPWLDASGADPYRIAAVPNASGFVGLLRGSKALVTLSSELRELARVSLPETPTALCVGAADAVWVASRYGRRLLKLTLGADGVVRSALERELPFAGVADLACGDHGMVYVSPVDGSELLSIDTTGAIRGRRPALSGGLRLQRQGRYLLDSSLFERSLRVLLLGADGTVGKELARIRHDGPLWAFDAQQHGSELLIAVAGAEDKPLVRAHGEFENIDSFVWIYRVDDTSHELAKLDVSDWGLVVPKAVQLGSSDGRVSVRVLASGSDRALSASWPANFHGEPEVKTERALPGASDAVFRDHGSILYADPLFDAWVKLDELGVQLVRVDPERRPEPDVRLGEALFFTELMAPDNTSAGTHSRFSCETCHFEGGVDGRVHYTGRADVSVVTKPLFGLANNRPHFSRAMDADLSSVCHNEFRVAGAGSGQSPWFTLQTARFPWLHDLGVDRAELGPLELREALLRFLYSFSPPPNPRSQGREHFSSLEAEGARAFRDHCASCHAARLRSDEQSSEVPFAEWESLVLVRNAPLVWARGEYAKTGILPYVHERGTRIPSLRRLALKPRYFTNGSARNLASVLERFRERTDPALHDSARHDAPHDSSAEGPFWRPLAPATRAALEAFLQLL